VILRPALFLAGLLKAAYIRRHQAATCLPAPRRKP